MEERTSNMKCSKKKKKGRKEGNEKNRKRKNITITPQLQATY